MNTADREQFQIQPWAEAHHVGACFAYRRYDTPIAGVSVGLDRKAAKR